MSMNCSALVRGVVKCAIPLLVRFNRALIGDKCDSWVN
jgi:hypothetical protein